MKGETAKELLVKIKEERKKALGKKYKELPPVDTTNLPQLPDGWLWAVLDAVSEKITDGEHIRPKIVADGIPFLSAKDVRNEGVCFDETLFISNDDADRFSKRCNPERGDILVVSRGATVGRSCIVDTNERFCLLGSVILIKLFQNLNPKFISYFIKSEQSQQQLMALSGSTAQQAIYIRDIRNVYLPLCTIEEQTIIVSEIERHFSVADETEKIIDQSLKQAERLRQSILKDAFSGKLVPQDPSDEPAEKLLERIKAEREKISKTKSNHQALPDGSPKENKKRRIK